MSKQQHCVEDRKASVRRLPMTDRTAIEGQGDTWEEAFAKVHQ